MHRGSGFRKGNGVADFGDVGASWACPWNVCACVELFDDLLQSLEARLCILCVMLCVRECLVWHHPVVQKQVKAADASDTMKDARAYYNKNIDPCISQISRSVKQTAQKTS